MNLDLQSSSCLVTGATGFIGANLVRELVRRGAVVHALARAYGWREADVLAMSEARRHFYLELVG